MILLLNLKLYLENAAFYAGRLKFPLLAMFSFCVILESKLFQAIINLQDYLKIYTQSSLIQ